MVRLKRFKTPLRKTLTHRIWVERIRRGAQGLRDLLEVLEELSRDTVKGLGT